MTSFLVRLGHAALFVALFSALTLTPHKLLFAQDPSNLTSLATGISFGGLTLFVSPPATPCVDPPGIYVLVLSARLATLGLLEGYVYTPATITKPLGRVPKPLVYILGKAIPTPGDVCLVYVGKSLVPIQTVYSVLPHSLIMGIMWTVGTGLLPPPKAFTGVGV